MVRKSDTTPPSRAKKPGAKSDRDARLKSALKANMAKRKAQARKRAGPSDAGGTKDPGQGA